MGDGELGRLLAASDEILVVAADCTQPTATMQRVGDLLDRIHSEGWRSRVVDHEVEGEVEVGLSFERIDLMVDDRRTILAAAAQRNPGTANQRSMAVVCFAPDDVGVCDLTVMLDRKA
jgi:hypothetical protein